jgi:hypothetical protein
MRKIKGISCCFFLLFLLLCTGTLSPDDLDKRYIQAGILVDERNIKGKLSTRLSQNIKNL